MAHVKCLRPGARITFPVEVSARGLAWNIKFSSRGSPHATLLSHLKLKVGKQFFSGAVHS